ncbi:ABC transporter ATP-binding protein [Accumulibacter sp.]|uniref:ABC transporter ATP-binding protein n=1 Tax=Accumulibacter sp. TaxID=2053492 RepID=UPI0025D31169|nr:ABC transporter ATP-binding protein [Accumulibacter sp.]MCM8595547.1 ABC transporter ATP-binding protein [Accumulibacter sp.]MCM8627281.1 ABC transporter ATP-binding protein [Accumulibacter sp.]MDS4049695.1 ABC transporter ATP-binding protein [Accumulibacter sp.]
MLSVVDLSKRYAGASRALFSGLGLAVAAGEIVALIGESGVGKSTLLNCIAGLETADRGSICIGPRATDVVRLDEAARAALRAQHIGFVFQAFHVLPTLSVEQNVAVPLLLSRVPRSEHARRIGTLLERVGLGGFERRWPASLSGGELQRVAIARALVHRPALILADEPTGNLDPRTAGEILDLLLERTRDQGAGALIVTHSQHVAERCDRTLLLTAEGLR